MQRRVWTPYYYKRFIPKYTRILRRCLCQRHQGVHYFQQIRQVQQPLFKIPHLDSVKIFLNRLELAVNVKQFRLDQIRVNVLCNRIEVFTCRSLQHPQQNLITTRIYHLPQRIQPTNSCCKINRAGILIVSVAWAN